jgi:hypothetical protein
MKKNQSILCAARVCEFFVHQRNQPGFLQMNPEPSWIFAFLPRSGKTAWPRGRLAQVERMCQPGLAPAKGRFVSFVCDKPAMDRWQVEGKQRSVDHGGYGVRLTRRPRAGTRVTMRRHTELLGQRRNAALAGGI